jgi:hypothetical protein
MTEFINLTPHAISVEGVGTLPPSGIIARVGTMRTACGALGGARIVSQNFGAVEGIPAPRNGVTYIVSGMVLDALKREAGPAGSSRAGRDVYAPDTGPDAIRENGQIVAVRGLVF